MIKKEITLDSRTVRALVKAIDFALAESMDSRRFTPNDERLLANYIRKLGVIR